jgi:hypothetical protein
MQIPAQAFMLILIARHGTRQKSADYAKGHRYVSTLDVRHSNTPREAAAVNVTEAFC